jgi:hypothetical protein
MINTDVDHEIAADAYRQVMAANPGIVREAVAQMDDGDLTDLFYINTGVAETPERQLAKVIRYMLAGLAAPLESAVDNLAGKVMAFEDTSLIDFYQNCYLEAVEDRAIEQQRNVKNAA